MSLCRGNKIEDETQRYSSMRDSPFQRWKKDDDIPKLSHENLISQLMNSYDYNVNLRLIIFTSSCFEIRDKFI